MALGMFDSMQCATVSWKLDGSWESAQIYRYEPGKKEWLATNDPMRVSDAGAGHTLVFAAISPQTANSLLLVYDKKKLPDSSWRQMLLDFYWGPSVVEYSHLRYRP